LNLEKVFVRPVIPLEEQRFQQLMQEHHYLDALPKISETIWYIATFGDQWVALLSFSAAALATPQFAVSPFSPKFIRS